MQEVIADVVDYRKVVEPLPYFLELLLYGVFLGMEMAPGLQSLHYEVGMQATAENPTWV